MQALIVQRVGAQIRYFELPGRVPTDPAGVPPAAKTRAKAILQVEGDLRVVILL